MRIWTIFSNREVKSHEAFPPNHEQRECDASEAPGLAPLSGTDGNAAQLDSARTAQGEARATARVVLMPLTVARFVETVSYLAQRGYRMKVKGRHVEMVKS